MGWGGAVVGKLLAHGLSRLRFRVGGAWAYPYLVGGGSVRSGILDTLGLPGAGKPVRLTAVPTLWCGC